MLANNNHRITDKLAWRSMKGKKGRYRVIAFAVFLSAFMLFSVLTVGAAYVKMKHVQDIRITGGDMDMVLMGGFTQEQFRLCKSSELIRTAGASSYAGYVEHTPWDDTPNVGLLWADKTCWEELKAPAREKMEGIYPQAENEILVTRKALEKCGAGDLDIGDRFTFTYANVWRGDENAESRTEEFVICGIWEGYTDQDAFYVSKSLFDKCGSPLEEIGQISLKFADFYVPESDKDQLREALKLEKQQMLMNTSVSEGGGEILLGLLGLVLITMLSAYLLIYNILYLSVSESTRYFGLLQTIGMTRRQVKSMLKKQMLLTGGAGLGGGILCGTAVSFGLVPAVVRSFGIRHVAVKPVFHPLIFLLTVLIGSGTVYIGGRKPLKLMADISPIEALGYQGIKPVKPGRRRRKGRESGTEGRKSRTESRKSDMENWKSRRGGFLWRTAKNQLIKDKKRTVMVILSMAVSLSVFLCLVTLIVSQGPRTIYSNYMNTDLTIINDTLRTEEESEWAQIMDLDFVDELRESEGIKEVHPLLRQKIIIPWEPEFTDKWMREFYDAWVVGVDYEDIVEEYKADPQKYYSFIKGIDEAELDYLNSTLEEPVDKTAFLKGETCLIYRNSLMLDEEDFSEENIKSTELELAFSDKPEETLAFKIAGFTDDVYYSDIDNGLPMVIVSNQWLEEKASEPHVSKINIQYEKEYDKQAEELVLSRMNSGPHSRDFSYESRIEGMENLKKAQGNMMGVGIGIVLILAFIGIMNYINTVFGNVANRQTAFSIMESVGMTEKQVKGLLMREGLIYAAGVLLVTGTAGFGVTYLCYQALNYMQIPFQVPVCPVLSAAAVTGLVCLIIPLISYRLVAKGRPLVERIRKFD